MHQYNTVQPIQMTVIEEHESKNNGYFQQLSSPSTSDGMVVDKLIIVSVCSAAYVSQ